MPYKGQGKRRKLKESPSTRTGGLNTSIKYSSLAELPCVRGVESLRKLSKSYLVPRSHITRLSLRSERVRKYVQRKSITSVSPHVLVENLDRVSMKASVVRMRSHPVPPNGETAEVENELRDRFSDCSLSEPPCTTISNATALLPASSASLASMSQRRLASNRPTLDRLLLLPPVPAFEKPDPLAASIPLPYHKFNTRNHRSSSRASGDTSISPVDVQPVTPVEQVFHERNSPPSAPRQTVRRRKRPSLLTSLLSQGLSGASDDVTSPYPFTPVEEQTGFLGVLSGSAEATPPATTKVHTPPSPKPVSPNVASPSVIIASRAPSRQVLSNIPRRLSYSHTVTSVPSPLSLGPPELPSLASPLLLQNPQSGAFTGIQDSFKSPLLHVSDSPNYFSM